MRMTYFCRSCTGISDHSCSMAGDESQQSACGKMLHIHGLRKSWCAWARSNALAEGVIATAEEMRVFKDAMTARRKVQLVRSTPLSQRALG